jgi:hypothetical protein
MKINYQEDKLLFFSVSFYGGKLFHHYLREKCICHYTYTEIKDELGRVLIHGVGNVIFLERNEMLCELIIGTIVIALLHDQHSGTEETIVSVVLFVYFT